VVKAQDHKCKIGMKFDKPDRIGEIREYVLQSLAELSCGGCEAPQASSEEQPMSSK
jgi:hypothetical protein